MSYDVFISYRRNSGDRTARLIRLELLRLGISTFLDVEDLGAYHFDDRILRSIDEAKDFIVVLSPGSLDVCLNEDDWLRKEIAYAILKDKNIVPILEPNFEFPPKGILPDDIASIHRYNCVPYSHEFFKATIEKLLVFLKSKPTSVRGGKIRTSLAAIAAVIAALAFFLWGSIQTSDDRAKATDRRAAANAGSIVPSVSSTSATVDQGTKNSQYARIACVTASDDQNNTVQVGSLIYGNEPSLRLTSGQNVLFYKMKSFEVSGLGVENKSPLAVKVAISLLNGNELSGDVTPPNDMLNGTTDSGAFQLNLLLTKRVEFMESGGCGK